MNNDPRSKVTIRPHSERGHSDIGWLNSYHTFSFGEYHDPHHMGFRTLRVLNDDTVFPQKGFGSHPHKDMEIISYVIEGELEHKDSMGHGSIIKAGHFQKMSAGSGVVHSEFNPSKDQKVHFLQMWIIPDKKGIDPMYQELAVNDLPKEKLQLIASNDATGHTVRIFQDVRLYFGSLSQEENVSYPLKPERGAWIQIITGKINLNGHKLSQGDGASIENESKISIKAEQKSEFLLFDLA